MDDQTNNSGPVSQPTPAQPEPVTPPAEPAMPSAEPAAPAASPQPEEKCVTCGGPATGGTCSACGQGEISCTCQPASPTGDQGQPTGGPSPSGVPGGSAPMV